MTLAKIRAALAYREVDGELCVRGTGEARGVPVRWSRTIDASSRIVEMVDGAIGHAVGFDGTHGWRVDESGMPGALDLGDLEDLVVTTAVWSGGWLRYGDVEVGDVRASGSEIVATIRAVRPWRGARAYRLSLDGQTFLPRRIEHAGRDDIALHFDDYRPGPLGPIAHLAVLREAWLSDTLRIDAIEATRDTSFAAPPALPSDTAFTDRELVHRRTRGKLALVRVDIDDRDAGWFALDTGASTCAIDEAVAATLGLPELGRRIVRTADGVAGAPYRIAKTVDVGPLSIAGMRLLEIDLAPFARAAGMTLAGVLGYDVFRRAAITIGDAVAIEARSLDDGVAIRFEDATPVVTATVPTATGTRDISLMIDTGSTAGVTLFAGSSTDLDLRGGARVALRGVSGAVGAHARTLPWMTIGDHRIEDVSALVARAGSGAAGSTHGAVAGNLGMGVLAAFTVTYDYANRRIALRRRSRIRRD